MSFNTRRNSVVNSAKAPFCKVCYDAGLTTDDFTSHFVKDQPGPNGRVVCPTLLAQKCLICGVPGHTSSYCPENSSVSSSSSSTVQKEKETRFSMAVATDEIRYPPHSLRLPPLHPIQKQQQQQPQYRPIPRIVYANDIHTKPTKPIESAHHEFPSLPNLSSVRRFENDEPQLKRELPTEASPVHSPIAPPSPKKWTRVKYNRKNNPFGVLDNNVDSDADDIDALPVIQKQDKTSSSSSSSWASIAAGSKSTVAAPKQQPQQRTRSRFSIVIPTAISVAGATLPLLPPISFKPKPMPASEIEKKQQVKKLWGDTDSEDDAEFLKRGLN